MGEREGPIVLWLGLSLSVSLCLWTVNFTDIYQVSPSPGGRPGWLEWAGDGHSPSPCQ